MKVEVEALSTRPLEFFPFVFYIPDSRFSPTETFLSVFPAPSFKYVSDLRVV